MSRRVNTVDESASTPQSEGAPYLSDWRMADSIGTAVVLSVADHLGCRPTALPLLSTAVDPDALDDLLADRGEAVSISFSYAGCSVSLRGDGKLTVE